MKKLFTILALAGLIGVGLAPAATADTGTTAGQNVNLTAQVATSLTLTFLSSTTISFGTVPVGNIPPAATKSVQYKVDTNSPAGFHVDVTPGAVPGGSVSFQIQKSTGGSSQPLTAPLNAWYTAPAGTTTQTDTDWFGVDVNTGAAAGTYNQTIVYTASLGPAHS